MRSARSSSPTAALKAANGLSIHGGVPRRGVIGVYVPQWIGTTPRSIQWCGGGAFGIEMAIAERRPPAPDRQQRHVDRGKVVHPLEQVGVAGEVDRSATGVDM